MRNTKTHTRLLAVLLCFAMAAPVFLSGCKRLDAQGQTATDETTLPTATVETAPVQLPPVVTGTGNADSIDCQPNYMTDSNPDSVVATVGDRQLTNRTLSLLYAMEVAAYRSSGAAEQPDYTSGLETQSCPLAKDLSWQHYFLQQAIDRWSKTQALNMGSTEPLLIAEEKYEPDPKRHEEYFAKDFPAKAVYYGDKECYTPNSLHQEYLDNIPNMLTDLAKQKGYASADEMAAAMAPGATAADLAAVAESMNRAYMFYTELSYSVNPDAPAEEPEGENGDTEATSDTAEPAQPAEPQVILGVGERLVNMRHILLIPENAAIAGDMTVTASDEDWQACAKFANTILEAINKDWRNYREGVDAVFAEKANQYSHDAGTRVVGGRYLNVRKGQMMDEVDAWLFDDARQPGDRTLMRTAMGYEILFFSGVTSEGEVEADKAFQNNTLAAATAAYLEKYPLQVDYSAVSLSEGSSDVTADDLLYPDIAHEHYPSIPLYLQQDFPRAMFGSRTVAKGGCGITTLAMISTYLTDRTLTPAMLAEAYSRYSGKWGTDGQIFTNTPPEMGYFLQGQTWSWDDVIAALNSGKIVVSLQYPGYFTTAGHYMALESITEDGLIVIRDSNIFNYKRLPEHINDCFDPEKIKPASQVYWIYEPKVTRIPACARCGDSAHSGVPGQLLRSDYTCDKCSAALTRRDGFLNLTK